jgi:hypothetical protein
MRATPLAAEFGISTWHKYLAGLTNSALASEQKAHRRQSPPPSLDNIWPEPNSQDLYWTNGKRPFTQGLV